MVKKLMGVTLALVLLLPMLVACTGPAGSAGPAGPAGPPGASAEQPTAAISIIPASATAKTSVTVLGVGFVPGEEIQVELTINGQPMLMGYREKVDGVMKQKHVADEYGTIRVISTIPRSENAPPGVYPIKATGDKGSVALTPLQVIE